MLSKTQSPVTKKKGLKMQKNAKRVLRQVFLKPEKRIKETMAFIMQDL